MRIGKLFGSWSWRVASGEFVLIFVGILAALAADDWNTRRIERHDEVAALGEIRSALAADLTELSDLSAQLRGLEERNQELAAYLDAGGGYSPDLDPLLGSVYGFVQAVLSTAPYEALKSRGLGLISNDSLRVLIVRVYDESFTGVERADDLQRGTILELFRPYFLRNFSDLRFNASATPLDPEGVLADPFFRNLVDYRIAILQQTIRPSYDTAIADARALLAAIEAELVGPVR